MGSIGSLPHHFFLKNYEWNTRTTISNDVVNQNLVFQVIVCSTGKINRVEQVIYHALTAQISQIPKHVDEVAVHETESICKEDLVHRFIAKVKVVNVAIICNTVGLDTIPDSFEFSAVSFELALTLHCACLLVNGKILAKNPCLLPHIPEPVEELINFEIGTVILWWWYCQQILATKEVTEGLVQLVAPRVDAVGNEIIAMNWLLCLRLHFLDESQ